MEHATSAVNWRDVNTAKREGELSQGCPHARRPRRRRRLLLPVAAVARGRRAVPLGDGAARRGAQPGLPRRRGARRTLAELAAGDRLGAGARASRDPLRLGVVVGGRARLAPVEPPALPGEALDWYTALLDLGVRADVIPVGSAFDDYEVVIAPMLHVVSADDARAARGIRSDGPRAHRHVLLGHRGRARPGLARRIPRRAARRCSASLVEEFVPLLPGEPRDPVQRRDGRRSGRSASALADDRRGAGRHTHTATSRASRRSRAVRSAAGERRTSPPTSAARTPDADRRTRCRHPGSARRCARRGRRARGHGASR